MSVHETQWKSMKKSWKSRREGFFFDSSIARRSSEIIHERRYFPARLWNLIHYDCHRLPGAIILKISHGYTINPYGPDPFVELADKAVGTVFAEAFQAGRWLVDVVPACTLHILSRAESMWPIHDLLTLVRYLPEWLPGAGFKKQAREWGRIVSDFYDKPFAFVKHQMVRATHAYEVPG